MPARSASSSTWAALSSLIVRRRSSRATSQPTINRITATIRSGRIATTELHDWRSDSRIALDLNIINLWAHRTATPAATELSLPAPDVNRNNDGNHKWAPYDRVPRVHHEGLHGVAA